MKELYSIKYQENPSPENESVLFEGINEEAFAAKGLKIKTFGIFIHDKNEKVVGGASGVTFYGSLYVDMLWLDKSLRNKGLGTKLMLETEKIGKERNCSFISLNTMD